MIRAVSVFLFMKVPLERPGVSHLLSRMLNDEQPQYL